MARGGINKALVQQARDALLGVWRSSLQELPIKKNYSL